MKIDPRSYFTKIFVIIALLFIVGVFAMMMCGFNYNVFDTTYNFDRAMIILPNGVLVEGKVDYWSDYEDGDQIQVTIDGTTYLAHSSNVVLIED